MNDPAPASSGKVIPVVPVVEDALYEVRKKHLSAQSVSGAFATWRWGPGVVYADHFLWTMLARLERPSGRPLSPRRAQVLSSSAGCSGRRTYSILALILIISAFALFLLTAVGGPIVVRLCLSANGLYRDLHVDRGEDRGRSLEAHETRRPADERAQVPHQGDQAVRMDRLRPVDRIHLRRLFHADQGTVAVYSELVARAVGDLLDLLLRLSRPMAMPATCASRSASTCARMHVSRG
jgi:hypothetical protein